MRAGRERTCSARTPREPRPRPRGHEAAGHVPVDTLPAGADVADPPHPPRPAPHRAWGWGYSDPATVHSAPGRGGFCAGNTGRREGRGGTLCWAGQHPPSPVSPEPESVPASGNEALVGVIGLRCSLGRNLPRVADVRMRRTRDDVQRVRPPDNRREPGSMRPRAVDAQALGEAKWTLPWGLQRGRGQQPAGLSEDSPAKSRS